MRRSVSLLASCLMLWGCSQPGGPYPSLQPRAAEGIDPRLSVAPLSAPAAASAQLLARADALLRQGRTGNDSFVSAIAEAERLAASAGARQSESWVVAQQALSAAAAARSATTRALADLDAVAAGQLQSASTIAPADLATIQAAAAELARLDAAQQARIDAVTRRLGS
ncbi:hypothetical protein G7077_02840 [Sphingomonas piscis]|uniref:DUF4398 domain-containing protein n=1 Tax=Sphingomonas piscis TaxID=2714943 RepID=A0A6G7YMQ9_9SPHN|nr:hypothetical protein [Sphingomonas piscis]QIK78006.1 hypothetical protein G7077_02840 [Sphingomonas piscis]